MRQYYRVMAPGDPERPDRPEYHVYRGGRGGGRAKRADKQSAKPSAGAPDEGRGYSVYKSRRGAGMFGALRERFSRGEGPERAPREGGGGITFRRVLKWVGLAAAAWLLLSVVLFAISAQIQKGKLDDAAAEQLGTLSPMLFSGQTILVIGTDARPEATGNPEAETDAKCIEQGATGSPPSGDCSGFRADTLMLVRAGGGAFEKLSIPRDTLAEVPGQGPQKINSAYATGGAALQIRTVESFLGIDVDHLVLLDFEGFAEFIDSIGGVDVEVSSRVKSKVDGGSGQGGITLKLERGEHHLDGHQALAYARTRQNLWNPAENDLDRARRQQEVVSAIKSRLTSPWRAPINFLRGPLIAWNAPKAMVTDMGALTLPQLALSMAIGGDSGTVILGKNAPISDAGNIIVPRNDCERALKKFLGHDPEEPPPCSPAG